MLGSVVFGLAALILLYSGASSATDAYVNRLRRVLTWHYLPILGWVVFFTLAAVSTTIPFAGSLGLAQVESSLTLGSLSASASVGFWLSFAALWIGAVKGNDL